MKSGAQFLQCLRCFCSKTNLPIVFEVNKKTTGVWNIVSHPPKTNRLDEKRMQFHELVFTKELCGSHFQRANFTPRTTDIF